MCVDHTGGRLCSVYEFAVINKMSKRDLTSTKATGNYFYIVCVSYTVDGVFGVCVCERALFVAVGVGSTLHSIGMLACVCVCVCVCVHVCPCDLNVSEAIKLEVGRICMLS